MADAVGPFGLPLLGLPGSVVLAIASEIGLQPVAEAFVDRAYEPDGRLVPRSVSGAVIHDEAVVCERAVRMATEHEVIAADGTIVHVEPQSLCVHGDTPGAVALASAVRRALGDAGIELAPFAGP